MNITLPHNGTVYEGEIGKVGRTELGYEDHGSFTGWLHFDFGSSSQGFGGRQMSGAYGLDWIKQLLRVGGVGNWESLKNIKLVALRTSPYGTIEGIANLEGTQVFIAQDHANEWFDNNGGN